MAARERAYAKLLRAVDPSARATRQKGVTELWADVHLGDLLPSALSKVVNRPLLILQGDAAHAQILLTAVDESDPTKPYAFRSDGPIVVRLSCNAYGVPHYDLIEHYTCPWAETAQEL